MIIDNLKNAGLYYGIDPRLKLALEYLQKTDFERLESGRYEIDGENVYAMVQQYESKPREQGAWEAHRKYTDIQYIVSGSEQIGYRCTDGMKVTQEYNETRDILFLDGEGSFFRVASGFFAIFAPQDAHMPCIAEDTPATVRKVVVKVRVK